MAILVEYDKNWSKLYKAQAKQIKKTLGKACVAAYHIGSTAIADVPSRPIIDILVVLKDANATEKLTEIGYIACNESTYLLQAEGIAYQAFCVDYSDRDKMDAYYGIFTAHRASKKDKLAWIEKKQAWATQFADDPQGYEDAKQAYFTEIAPEARDKNRRDQKVGTSVAIGMCLGSSIGLCLGSALGHIGAGMCIGIGIGVCLGCVLGSVGNNPKGGK